MESGVLVGFLLPGDSILFTAGLLAAEPVSTLSLPVLALGAFVCAAAGNGVGYWTGHRFGRPWLLHRAGRAAGHVERAERFYVRYGWLAVVVARFVPWARTFTPVLGRGRLGCRWPGSWRPHSPAPHCGAPAWSRWGTRPTGCRGCGTWPTESRPSPSPPPCRSAGRMAAPAAAVRRFRPRPAGPGRAS